MGSVGDQTYSVPSEAKKIFCTEILDNPLIPTLPAEIQNAGKLVHFSGNAKPSIPINWRFAESVSALKAFEASMLNVLRAKKYGVEFSKVNINTDHASLFIMSPFLTKVVDTDGETKTFSPWGAEGGGYGFPSTDLHDMAPLHRMLATNIYRTKDGRYYHVHGSMNSDATLAALGLPTHGEVTDTYDSVTERIQRVVEKIDSKHLDEMMNDTYKQAGTIAWTTDEFFESEHGKANAQIGLYGLQKISRHAQPASWWPENFSLPSSPKRVLAGLKVVDLTRGRWIKA